MKPGQSARLRVGADEESRAYLQARIDLLSRVLFISFVAVIVVLALFYTVYPIPVRNNPVIFALALVGVAMLAVIWRGILTRRKLTIGQLYAIDTFYMAATGVFFATSTALAYDYPPAGYANLLYTSFMCLGRATVVPSTARRTFVTGLLEFVPMIGVALGLVIAGDNDLRVPGPAYVAGGVFTAAVVIVLSTVASRTIYSLQLKVSQAQQLGRYTLDRKIAEGGMGTVWIAHHELLRRPTAIKLVLPDKAGADTLDRFEREVQAMSQLSHPNTVAVFDYGRTPEGVFYYAMEYLPGIDLERLVQRFGPQPAQRVIRILAQVCGALHEAHGKGIVHRDIKPGNIILSERGGALDVAKVVDFGLVQELSASHAGTTQHVLGTPAYLAPEAITDPTAVGPAADLYALGAVGYFLLTGKRVFDGALVDLVIHHVRTPAARPSTVAAVTIPEALEDLVMACLAKAPADRPASAAALEAKLRALADPGDWGDDAAARWWAELRAHDDKQAQLADAATITVTIDLTERASGPPVMTAGRPVVRSRDRSSRVR